MNGDPLKFWKGLAIGLPLALLLWGALIWSGYQLVTSYSSRSNPTVGLALQRSKPFVCFPAHPMLRSSSTDGTTTRDSRQ